jgi:hypothetical protein
MFYIRAYLEGKNRGSRRLRGTLGNVADCPQAICREIGFANVGFRIVVGLDTEQVLDLYEKFIRRATTHICFAEDTENSGGEYINVADGARMTAFLQSRFDLVSDVPPDCLAANGSGILCSHTTWQFRARTFKAVSTKYGT